MSLNVDAPNQWRLQSPGHAGWPRTARPGDPRKYVIISADCHANEPSTLWAERIDKKYRERIPRVITDANGVLWRVSEGHRPDRLRVQDLEGEDMLRQKAGADPRDRLRDHARDGIDAEMIFPNKGLSMWATPDAVFAQAQCRVFNEWAWETFGPYNDRLSPAAAIATADLEGSIAEVQRVAKLGFRALTLPCKPVWGGHAVINYVSHSLSPTIEPVANLCASGVLERFPGLKFATIEAGIGWVAWLLDAMDEAYRKHHFWVRPKLAKLPSERLPAPIEAAAYFVVAEALTNVAKYANATCVDVSVTPSNGTVCVEVVDDGVGGADIARGSGLRGLADRVEALAGRLEVESVPGAGTTVRALLPSG